MEKNLYKPKKSGKERERREEQFLAEMEPAYTFTDEPPGGGDDDMKWFPYATRNEYGDLILSGKRIA